MSIVIILFLKISILNSILMANPGSYSEPGLRCFCCRISSKLWLMSLNIIQFRCKPSLPYGISPNAIKLSGWWGHQPRKTPGAGVPTSTLMLLT